MALTAREIQDAYVTFFNRAADTEGFTYWTSYPGSISDLYATFALQTEYTSVYGGKTVELQITTVYVNLFNRAPDAEGLAYWKPLVEAGTISLANLALTVNRGAQGTDTTALSGKIDAAIVTTNAAVAANLPGQNFTLTTSTDALSGTNGSDTFNGVLQANGATGTTAQPGDLINGGEGIDTLRISVAGDIGNAGFTISAIQTTGVEKLFLSNFQTNATPAVTTVATDLMSGLTTVGLSASSATGDAAFTGLNGIVDAEMRNGAGDLTLTYGAAAVVGTADTQKLAVSNLSAGTFTADGIETLAITSGIVKSTLAAVVSDKLKTVTVSGDKDLTITAAVDFVAGTNGDTTIDATIDASTFTGKLSVVASDTNDIEVKGGSANDTIAMAGALTKTDKIDGGAGDDTLTMTAATLTTQFAGVSNIETVAFTAGVADATMDVSKLSAGVTKVQMDLSDGTDGGGADILGTISNLDGQAVVLKHTVANAADTDQSDGVAFTITNKLDTAADSVSITLDAIGVTSIANNATSDFGIDVLDVANFETVNLNSKKSATVTANEVRGLTDSSATTLNLTGDADLTITQSGTKLTKLDAAGLDGKLAVTLGANKVSVTGTAKDDTFTFAGNLDNNDVVVGGAGKDTLTATLTGATAATGKLNISGVETVTLNTTGSNTLNLAGVTGATTIAVSANTQTITGYDLGANLQMTANATVDVTAADATGTTDVLKVEQKVDGDVTNVVKSTGIETLDITVSDTAATANSATFTLTNFDGTKVVARESATTVTTGSNIALGTLNKSVVTVDTSGIKGTQSASTANATAATTFNLGGTAAATVTGSAQADTFNIASTGAVSHSITGGNGTDTTNLSVKAGWVVSSGIATENLNIAVKAGDSITMTAGTAMNAASTAITLTGGNSLSVFTTPKTTSALADTVKTFDASQFQGTIAAHVVNDKLDDTVTITGGASTTDSVTAAYATAGTYKVKTVGVETLNVSADGTGTSAFVLDLSSTSGVTTVSATVAAADTLTVDKYVDQLINVVSATSTSVVEAKMADATGANDAAFFELKDAATNIAAGAALKTTDIETVNIKASTAESITLANVTMGTAGKTASVVVTGTAALTVSASNSAINSINASGMSTGGSFVQTGRSATSAVTYTGSDGADTFIMSNTGDVINGGAGTNDTLKIAKAAILGGLNVDLSAADEQILSFNGSATSGTVTGFENVDASGYTGSFGAQITAIKTGSTITGTANADQITGGAGADTFVVNAGTVANSDVMDGGTGTDILQVATGLTYTQATDASLTNVETINLIGTASAVLTGQTEAFTINDGAGANSITGGKGNDTIALTAADAAVDTLVFANTAANNGADVITGFNTGDVLNFAAFIAATKDIAGGAIAITSSLGVSIANSLDYGTNVVNVITLADIQTLTAANFAGTASATAIKTAASAKYIVIGDVAADADTIQNIYYVSTDGANAATVTLVGTMNEFTIVTANLTTA